LLTEDIQGGHQPRKDVKVREFESGQGKVWKKRAEVRENPWEMCSCLWYATMSNAIGKRRL